MSRMARPRRTLAAQKRLLGQLPDLRQVLRGSLVTRCPLVHIRHRDPLPGGGPASSREENSEEALRRIKDLLAK